MRRIVLLSMVMGMLGLAAGAEAHWGRHHGGGRWGGDVCNGCQIWHPDAVKMLTPPGPIHAGEFGYGYPYGTGTFYGYPSAPMTVPLVVPPTAPAVTPPPPVPAPVPAPEPAPVDPTAAAH